MSYTALFKRRRGDGTDLGRAKIIFFCRELVGEMTLIRDAGFMGYGIMDMELCYVRMM